MKYYHIITFIIVTTSLIAKSSYPGLHIFTSSNDLSLGGSGLLYGSSISSKINPGVNFTDKIISTSLTKFPAQITSENIGVGFPFKKGSGSISIFHVTYGTFQGYNELAEKTSNYTSQDLSLRGSYSKLAKKLPLRFGFSTQLLRSSLSKLENYYISISIGSIFILSKDNLKLGFSVHNLGKQLNNNFDMDNEVELVFSILKKLNYLPLQVFVDFSNKRESSSTEIFIGGCLSPKETIKINFGTSTRKLTQNTKQSLGKSILGNTGFGFSYRLSNAIINYGSFFYNNGVLIHSLGLEIPF